MNPPQKQGARTRGLVCGWLVTMVCTTALSLFAQRCHQAKLSGHVVSGQAFQQSIGSGLDFWLDPFVKNQGWFIRIGPHGSTADWAFVVNPPFHADNSQYMGSGYGDTVRYQLERPHEVQFTTTSTQYGLFESMADAAMSGKDVDGYWKALRKADLGLAVVEATNYDKLGPEDEARWMDFQVTVTVPNSYRTGDELQWLSAACPSSTR
jgi:hypothetical protein